MSAPFARWLVVAPAIVALGCPAAPAGPGAVEPVPAPVPVPEPVPVPVPEPVPVPVPEPEPVPVPVPVPVPAPEPEPVPAPGFLGGDDEALLARICDEAPERWERNRGGTTISFRLVFADGTMAAYKPEQLVGHSHWEAEVAAYRLNRRLGMNRVPPSCRRSATRDELLEAEGVTADFRTRLRDEVPFDADGTVPGMAMYWVPSLKGGEEFALDGDWKWWVAKGGNIPEGREQDAAALSDMLLLDWLTLNVDRWTGGQIRRQGAMDGPIVLIDNAAGFGADPDQNTGRVWPSFRLAQRFRPAVVEQLRALDDGTIDELLGDILDSEQLRGLRERRDRALERIDQLIDQFGEDSVLYFR
jgi:hypothetical protein